MGLAFILLLSIGEFFGISYVFACIIFMIVYPFLLIYIHIYGDKVFNFFYKKMIDKSLAIHELVGKNGKLQPNGSSKAVQAYIKKMSGRMQFFYSFLVALVFLTVGASVLTLPRNIVGDLSNELLGTIGFIATLLFLCSMWTTLKWNAMWNAMYRQYFEVHRQAQRSQDNTFGSAKFDAKEEISNEWHKGNDIYIGETQFISANKKTHLITIAPSRSGKGTSLILPNLLLGFSNSYVVLDIKGENAAVSARRQRDLGKDVVIIDPWGVQENIGATHGITPMAFNPLALLEGMSDEQLFEECTSIAELIAPMPKNVKDPFWINRARVLIRGLLLYHIKSETPANWSLLAIYKVLRLSELEFIKNIVIGCETPLAADDLNQFKGKAPSEKEFGSIVSSAQDATEFIRNVSKGGGVAFNPKQLNEKPTALYVCIPERAIDTNYQWLRLVIGLSIRAISENVKNKQVERTVFLLDEAHYLGNMPEIRKALATSATYGICIWQFYQDIGQVQAAYGEYWHTIMNVGVQQFYKIGDLNTQKYVSELLGDRTIQVQNTSTNSKGEESFSTSTTAARLLTPEQVGKEKKIITRIGAGKYLLLALDYYDPEFELDYDKNPLV